METALFNSKGLRTNTWTSKNNSKKQQLFCILPDCPSNTHTRDTRYQKWRVHKQCYIAIGQLALFDQIVKYLSKCLTLYTVQALFAVLLLLSKSWTMCSIQYHTSVISNSEWNITANEWQCDAPHSQCRDAVILTSSINLIKRTFK